MQLTAIALSLSRIYGPLGGVAVFTPASLFIGGEQGAWYDPSDLSTLYQDAAGTTPVTAVEQLVGLMLDKSKGLTLGPELVTNGDFSNGTTGWTAAGDGASIAVVSGALQVTRTQAAGSTGYQLVNTVAGKTYRVTGIQRRVSGSTFSNIVARVSIDPSSTPLGAGVASSSLTFTQNAFYFSATSTTTYLHLTAGTDVGTAAFDNISVRELPGNHAFQSTSTKRPALSARVNLLTKTEQFDDGAWVKVNATVTANAAVAPDGTVTANKVVATNSASTTRCVYQSFTPVSGVQYVISFYAKAAEYTKFSICEIGGGRFGASYDLVAENTTSLGGAGFVSSSITKVGSGWYRCSIIVNATYGWALAVVGYPAGASLSAAGVSYAGDGTSGIYIWGADLRPANAGANLPAYQRVNTATDYDTVGFPKYLKTDGIDDFMVTNTITPGTDKAQVFAGVRKLSDAAGMMVSELSTNWLSNNGTFAFTAPDGVAAGYGIALRGNASAYASLATFSAPVSNVVTEQFNIAGSTPASEIQGRVNGANVTLSNVSGANTGTGNFLAYPLYLFMRAGTSLPFNGHFYGMILRFGANLDDSTILKTEEWMNNKTLALDWRDISDSASFRWNSATASPDAE